MAERESCPNCGRFIGAPGMFHGGGSTGMTMHTHRECEGCGKPLIWFHEGDELPERWMIDEAEERRKRVDPLND